MDGGGSPVQSTYSAFVTPLMISMAGMVATTLAIVAYYFFLLRYCVRRQADANDNRSLPIQSPQLPAGVEEKILKTIPIKTFSKEKAGGPFYSDQSECVVCLGELEEGDAIRLLPNCRHMHIFHLSCIDNWFFAHTSCPVCRSPVAPELDSTASTASAPPSGDDLDGQRTRNLHQDSGDGSSASGAGSIDNNNNSNALLGHRASFVLPRQHLRTELKRSLSLDQSYVLINLGGESERMAVSCSSSGCSYKVQLKRQFDRTRKCSRLLRSFSQLRIGTASTANQILIEISDGLPAEMI
ncbi:hypothetical protein SLEP1_g21609 [Rubroshorea leprosula]|uniref:RING-type E3 ubiquitin transferase n=1 Tax=Rubroshorea leprosula TaxID=152421 RepID=A0AAV5J6H4_9ROSI|nr:hypothetical protein SLEP1_g21609 [Rubroshorea leprosula]